MKVLFLDCDGVINCADTFHKEHDQYFPNDQYMCFLVGKIALDTDCKVVLSSSWRHHDKSVEWINQRLVPLYGMTPYESYDHNLPPGAENCLRGREIKAWLNEHPEVERYAIIDDDSDMLPEQMPNFFKTSWQTGLTKEIAEAVIEHLNKVVCPAPPFEQ